MKKKVLVIIDANHVIGIVKSTSKGTNAFGLTQLLKELPLYIADLINGPRSSPGDEVDIDISYVYISSRTPGSGTRNVCEQLGIPMSRSSCVEYYTQHKKDSGTSIFVFSSLRNFIEMDVSKEQETYLLYFDEEDELGLNKNDPQRIPFGGIDRVSYNNKKKKSS